MKRILWGVTVFLVISFIVWSKNPIDDTVNFIIGGTIPGTKNSIGFWPMIGLATTTLVFIKKAFASLKFQMLAHTATEIKSEAAKKEFEEAHNYEFDRSKRSVIAARQ